MPPYFNLLLVIFSHLRSEPEIFVHITQRRDFGDTAVCPVVPSQNGSQASKMARTLGVLGLFSAGWCTILTRTENRTHPQNWLKGGNVSEGVGGRYLLPSYSYLFSGKIGFHRLTLCTWTVPPAPSGLDRSPDYPGGAEHRRCSDISLCRYVS